MADRYQDRPLNADGFGRGGDQHQRADSDPLAELARLIGQNNESTGRNNPSPASPAAVPQNQFQPAAEAGGPPPWMQRANRKEIPREEQRDFEIDEPDQSHFQALSNALNRYGAQPPPVDQNFRDEAPSFGTTEGQPDPSRYDDALFGQINAGTHDEDHHHDDNAFPDDPYAYQEDGYDDEEAEE